MKIEKVNSKDKIRKLLFLTYIGEWIVTAFKHDEPRREYSDVLDKMLRYAHKCGLDEYVSWEEGSGKIGPSILLEEECQKFMDEYNDKFFADELADRLSKVDMEALIRSQKAS